MQHKAEDFSSAIVVLGAFNPAIFSPDWLNGQGLIGDGDVAAAREGNGGGEILVSRQVTTVETEWFVLQVEQNKFNLTSKGVLSPALKDLAVGIFQSLPHTPVTAVGLNFMAHYKFANEQQWHKFGDVLAPKGIWNSLYPDLHAGLSNLMITIEPATRSSDGRAKERRNITVQPSRKVKAGAFLSYNHHRELRREDSEDRVSADYVARIIDEKWESEWQEAERVLQRVVTDALGE